MMIKQGTGPYIYWYRHGFHLPVLVLYSRWPI